MIHVVKQHDRTPPLILTLNDAATQADTAAWDLTGITDAQVRFTIFDAVTYVPYVDGEPGAVENAVERKVRWEWGTEVDTIDRLGTRDLGVIVVVDRPGEGPRAFPTRGWYVVRVEALPTATP